ncbi:GFA family protein [Sphingobium sp. ba1]|uniref:GFA family protein n=1 Tax=Sphingobium sp. ba1 TaxID=1522072 RepID=UPI00069063C4|nr:GFA family protein [Sphingobium sp. ba1]
MGRGVRALEINDVATGGCLCGRVSYRLAKDPLLTAICHCTHCQKQSGAAFSVNLVVQAADLVIAGDMASFEDRGDSGNMIHRRFCASCGSPIITVPVGKPGIVYLKAGTLNDTSGIDPAVQIWCSSAQSWWPPETELTAFDQNMPG